MLVALIDVAHDRGERLEFARLRGCRQGQFLVVSCKEMMLQTFEIIVVAHLPKLDEVQPKELREFSLFPLDRLSSPSQQR